MQFIAMTNVDFKFLIVLDLTSIYNVMIINLSRKNANMQMFKHEWTFALLKK